jgi:hypothetical protein
MSIGTFCHELSRHLAGAVALLASGALAVITAVFGAGVVNFLRDHVRGGSVDLGNGILSMFYRANSLAAVVAFIACSTSPSYVL